MEDEIRFLYFTDIAKFAEDEDIPIIFPSNDPVSDISDVVENDSFTFQQVEISDIFLRPKITSLSPYHNGRIKGGAQYKWHVQISIYTRNSYGELDAARVFDKLRLVFAFGDKKQGDSRIYTQMTNMRAESPITMAGFVSLPTMFETHTIS